MQQPEHEQTAEVTEEMVREWKKAHRASTEDLWRFQHQTAEVVPLPGVENVRYYREQLGMASRWATLTDSPDWQNAPKFYIPVTRQSLKEQIKRYTQWPPSPHRA